MKNFLITITVILFPHYFLIAQKSKTPATGVVFAFWNVENLYDTIDDPLKDDDEFTPRGKLTWTSERYHQKIENLARVISSLDSEIPGATLGLMGLCEIENLQVLDDLIRSPAIGPLKLKSLLIEGPDARGVDVALVYRGDQFELKKTISVSYTLPVDTAHKTRDILVANGMWNGEPLCILVNHWPSRRGGETVSRPNRLAAAKKVREIYDSINHNLPGTRIVIMGDFNDDPVDLSIKKNLGTVTLQKEQTNTLLFNPMEKLYRAGLGTLAWRDAWNLFDQILLSPSWKKESSNLQFSVAAIYNKKFLTADYGKYKNYPFRTYSGGAYTGGFSDHYPVFVVFKASKAAD